MTPLTGYQITALIIVPLISVIVALRAVDRYVIATAIHRHATINPRQTPKPEFPHGRCNWAGCIAVVSVALLAFNHFQS